LGPGAHRAPNPPPAPPPPLRLLRLRLLRLRLLRLSLLGLRLLMPRLSISRFQPIFPDFDPYAFSKKKVLSKKLLNTATVSYSTPFFLASNLKTKRK
jgi:hypothetical protein